ncbi:MAG: DMT family transporter [Kiritimatiellia bacterium]
MRADLLPSLRRRLVGVLLAAISVTAFAATFVVGAELTKDCGLSPAVLSLLRFVVAGGVMFAWEARSADGRQRLFRAPTRRDWCLFAVLGPIGTSIMAWCVFMGCARVSATNASMADALSPLLIFVLAALHARRVTAVQTLGVLCGFVGALFVIGVVNGDGLALAAYSVGDLYVFFAAATWAFYSVYGRANIKRLGAGPYTTWTMLIGAAVIGVAMLVCRFASPDALGAFVWPTTPRAWGLVAVLGIVCTLTPFWTWNAAQKYLPVSTLGISAYFTPVVAVLLAGVFLGEHATALQWFGIALICASALVEVKS